MSDYSIENDDKSMSHKHGFASNISLGIYVNGLVSLTLTLYSIFYLMFLASLTHEENNLLSNNPWLSQVLHNPFTYLISVFPFLSWSPFTWLFASQSTDQFCSFVFTGLWFLSFNMGSSQSAPVQQVVNTIEQFGYHPARVFKFFVVIGIIANVTIFALAIWRHKKALDVSASLRAAKAIRKATQQDAYIECSVRERKCWVTLEACNFWWNKLNMLYFF